MSKKKNKLKAEELPNELVAEQAPQEEKLDFDAWYVMRQGQIPRAHRKEILQADFKGRGLSMHETLKDFDAALAKYGIKLA